VEALRRILNDTREHIRGLKEGDKELKALELLSGMNKEQLLKFYTESDDGPKLTVKRMTYGNGAKGLDDGDGGPAILGKMTPSADPGQGEIALDEGIVSAVSDGIQSEANGCAVGSFRGINWGNSQPPEQSYESPDIKTTMDAAVTFGSRVLEHETTHWGAFYIKHMGKDDDAIIPAVPLVGINMKFERGQTFEYMAFGNRGNTMSAGPSGGGWAIFSKYTQIQFNWSKNNSKVITPGGQGPADAQRRTFADAFHLVKQD